MIDFKSMFGPDAPADAKYREQYDAYCADRRGYGFTVLPYATWLSWYLGISLADLRARSEAGETF